MSQIEWVKDGDYEHSMRQVVRGYINSDEFPGATVVPSAKDTGRGVGNYASGASIGFNPHKPNIDIPIVDYDAEGNKIAEHHLYNVGEKKIETQTAPPTETKSPTMGLEAPRPSVELQLVTDTAMMPFRVDQAVLNVEKQFLVLIKNKKNNATAIPRFKEDTEFTLAIDGYEDELKAKFFGHQFEVASELEQVLLILV